MNVYAEKLQQVETDLTNKTIIAVIGKLSADFFAKQNTVKSLNVRRSKICH